MFLANCRFHGVRLEVLFITIGNMGRFLFRKGARNLSRAFLSRNTEVPRLVTVFYSTFCSVNVFWTLSLVVACNCYSNRKNFNVTL